MSISSAFTIKRRPYPISLLYLGTILIVTTAWLPRLSGVTVGEPLLDLVFAASSAALLWVYGARKDRLFAQQLFWIGYLVVGAALAVGLRNTNPLDFAQAYKFVWYLILLAPFAWAPGPMKSEDFRRLLNLCLFMFFSVYLAKRVIGIDRPVLMTENNFEIIFLSLVYFSAHVSGVKISGLQTGTLLAVVILSGSRSAAIAAALAVLFAFDFRSRNSAKVVGGMIAGTAAVVFAFLIFENRSQGGIESIDRFRFLMMFLESIRDWDTTDYLLGADRISPLPAHVCSSLSYYQSLFSFSGNGSCYSVILHSFNMRVIYDHGLAVTALTFIHLIGVMKNAKRHQRLCVILIVLASGLSVSALNNVYTTLGIALVCLAAGAAKNERCE